MSYEYLWSRARHSVPLTGRVSRHAEKQLTVRGDLGRGHGCRLWHGVERKIDWLLSELPDRRDSTQDEEAVRDRLKQTAFFFFRAHEQGVGRFVDFVICLVFHKDLLVAVSPYAKLVPPAKTNW